MNRSSTKIDVVEDVELGQVQRRARKYTIDTLDRMFLVKHMEVQLQKIYIILRIQRETHQNHLPKCSHKPIGPAPEH